MNDFLRNLRSSHKKEAPPQQKNMDSRFYPSDRRSMRDRRATPQANIGQPSPLKDLGDNFPQLLDQLSVIAEHMERMATVNERVSESQIRKNEAMTHFFENLEQMIKDMPAQAQFPTERPMATASYASGTHYTKDDILAIINGMRDQGATYSIIAEYLREKRIPTFSGRGEWHAQTIHRLCKE